MKSTAEKNEKHTMATGGRKQKALDVDIRNLKFNFTQEDKGVC